MARIRLSNREYRLLNLCNKNLNLDYSVELQINSKEDLEEIIDSISNYFSKRGVRRNDEPNVLGPELEELNDKFISLLQDLEV